MNKGIKILIFLGIIFAIFAPLLFTQGLTQFDFTETGQIGDTIGGTTAPIIGILGSILLFYTLWEQIQFNKKQNKFNEEQENFNRKQMDISSDEQFKSTFFNLLQVQRDILQRISGTFEILDGACINVKRYDSNGVDFFKASKTQLNLIYLALDNTDFYSGYNSEDAYLANESMQEHIIMGSNLPEEIEAENEKLINETHIPFKIAYINDKYGISKKSHEKYQQLDINKKIGIGYAFFFNRHETIGYYFRHLYYIFKFIKKNEDDKILALGNNPKQEEVEKIKNEYYLYAQFIQAQMSTDELLLTLYNSFTFPRAQELIIHYNLLENLTIQNLIKKEHNCNPEIRLKNRTNIFTNLINNHDNTN